MNLRLTAGVVVVLCMSTVASAQTCRTIHSGQCIDFESLFGYEHNPNFCSETTCEMDQGGNWNCPEDGTDVYNYHNNSVDIYFGSALGEDGNTELSIVQGDECIQSRRCGGCQTYVGTAAPGCLFEDGSTWQDFLWGSAITYVGDSCQG